MKGGRGKNIPNDDHVMRYVPWGRLRKDGDDNVVGFLPQAFQLRQDEDYLSVNWLEFYDGDRETQIRLSVWVIRDSFERPLGGKSAFAIGNVGKIKDISEAVGSRVRIVHEPDDEKNPAHCGMRQLPRDDLTLLEALASDAFTERVNNADVPGRTPQPPGEYDLT
jgi:hypothetical protein